MCDRCLIFEVAIVILIFDWGDRCLIFDWGDRDFWGDRCLIFDEVAIFYPMLKFNKVNILVRNSLMNTLVEIKTAIARLSDDETSALLSWLQERSEDDWDKQIKKDSEQGKLNKVIQRAKAHIAANRVKKLDEVINNS